MIETLLAGIDNVVLHVIESVYRDGSNNFAIPTIIPVKSFCSEDPFTNLDGQVAFYELKTWTETLIGEA